MRIRLRPYHPTYVVGYFGAGGKTEGYNKHGFNDVIARIKKDPDIEVELTEQVDDICAKCERRFRDRKGSIWGPDFNCPSAEDPQIIRGVNEANKLVLDALGLQFGSVVRFRGIVRLLAERIPILDHDFIGGTVFQDRYEKGLTLLLRPGE